MAMDDTPDTGFSTREHAQERADALNRETPDGADHRWLVHQADGERWEVVRVTVAGARFGREGRDAVGGRGPEREAPDDPRPTITRLIPPYGPGGM